MGLGKMAPAQGGVQRVDVEFGARGALQLCPAPLPPHQLPFEGDLGPTGSGEAARGGIKRGAGSTSSDCRQDLVRISAWLCFLSTQTGPLCSDKIL